MELSEFFTEIFLLKMKQSDILSFIKQAKRVHEFFLGLQGYSRMDILHHNQDEIMVLIHWNNESNFEKNLPQLLHACLVTSWLKMAVTVSHQPAILKSFDQKLNT